MLDETRLDIQNLEGSQSEADEKISAVTGAMNQLRTQQAALEAEGATARSHIEDLKRLQADAQGDRDRKLADIDGIRAEIAYLNGQIQHQLQRQKENQEDTQKVKEELQQAMAEYARIEAAKSRTEQDLQEKNKSILTMERACALLESKKETTALEERTPLTSCGILTA